MSGSFEPAHTAVDVVDLSVGLAVVVYDFIVGAEKSEHKSMRKVQETKPPDLWVCRCR